MNAAPKPTVANVAPPSLASLAEDCVPRRPHLDEARAALASAADALDGWYAR
jgi:hypothetical protein